MATRFVVAERTAYTQRFERVGTGADDLAICVALAEAYSEFHPLAQVVVFRSQMPQGFDRTSRRFYQVGLNDAALYEREFGVQMPITSSLSGIVNSRESDWF